MFKQLKSIGLVKKNCPDDLGHTISKIFMIHSIGHSIGLDTHDPTNQPIVLQSGSMLAIEPGLYFNDYVIRKIPTDIKKFINHKMVSECIKAQIGGIRIEDVVQVTKNGCKVLTDFVPKEIHDLERLRIVR